MITPLLNIDKVGGTAVSSAVGPPSFCSPVTTLPWNPAQRSNTWSSEPDALMDSIMRMALKLDDRSLPRSDRS